MSRRVEEAANATARTAGLAGWLLATGYWLVVSGHLLTGYESHGVGGELASAGRDSVGAMAALAFSGM